MPGVLAASKLSGPMILGALWAQARGAHLGREGLRAIAAYKSMRVTPELFSDWPRDWFDPRYLEMQGRMQNGSESAFLDLARKEGPGIFSFPIFTETFCSLFLKEIDNYLASGLPVRRPNSMNNYGLIVNEIGMRDALTRLQQTHLLPIARLLFPQESTRFDNHHSFMVQYKGGQDLGLDMHTDDSDVTFNICLGREFEGAGLSFCGMRGEPDHRQFKVSYTHVVGRAVVHSGDRRHGADDIQSGERNNLIIWNHNHEWRNSHEYLERRSAYQREASPPDVRCISYTHDRDYRLFKEPPPGIWRGWCPPPGKEYEGFGKVSRLEQPDTKHAHGGDGAEVVPTARDEL